MDDAVRKVGPLAVHRAGDRRLACLQKREHHPGDRRLNLKRLRINRRIDASPEPIRLVKGRAEMFHR